MFMQMHLSSALLRTNGNINKIHEIIRIRAIEHIWYQCAINAKLTCLLIYTVPSWIISMHLKMFSKSAQLHLIKWHKQREVSF